jgi:hypothetical protein
MGNYTRQGYVGGNVALEFLHNGPRLLHRTQLNNGHGAPVPGASP